MVTLQNKDVSGWVELALISLGAQGGSGGGRAGSRSGKVALASEEVDPPPLPKAWDENSFFLFALPGPQSISMSPPPSFFKCFPPHPPGQIGPLYSSLKGHQGCRDPAPRLCVRSRAAGDPPLRPRRRVTPGNSSNYGDFQPPPTQLAEPPHPTPSSHTASFPSRGDCHLRTLSPAPGLPWR